jgi:acid phosphatase class B
MQTVLVQLDSNVSPELAFGLKNYLIDIDGTITEDVPNEQPERMSIVEPFEGAVDMINSWYKEGHVITFFTSRTDEHELVTKQWLEKWNFKYHNIIFNKPRGGNYHWIDNHIVRATRYNGRWSKLVNKTHNIEVFE